MKKDQFVSLRDVADQAADTVAPKNAPLAWVLSLVLPGTGQIYCGAAVRGVVVYVLLAVALTLSLRAFHPNQILPQAVAIVFVGGWFASDALRALPILWAFASFDAYLTAREVNEGLNPTLVDNPRVAAVLNLLTRGLGYFYLGEKTKGFVLFFGLGLAPLLLIPAVRSVPGLVLARWLLEGVVMGVAIDAYRMGRQSLNETRAGLSPRALDAPPTGLPTVVPAGVAALFLSLWVGLFVYASAVVLSQPQFLIDFVRERQGAL